jgi:hypothetical protein
MKTKLYLSPFPTKQVSKTFFHSAPLGTLVEAGGTPYHERQAQIGARFQF